MSDDPMTPPEPPAPEEQDDLMAAELALGLLEGAEAAQAMTRLAEPEFAARVRQWQERLAGLADELTPVMPPLRARQRIRQTLGHVAAPLSQPIDSRIRWWQRPLALLSAVAAAVVLVAVLLMPALRSDGPGRYHADLTAAQPGLRVSARLNGREIEVALQQGSPAEGRDWEIWWVTPDGAAPVSLGVVPRQGALREQLPQGLEMVQGVQIALSDEPFGGSPTGQATGPIISIAPLAPS